MFKKSRLILDAFKQSRSWIQLHNQQKRTIFKYFKIEPQEKMDGFAKAKEHFKKVPKEYLLAPRYRLRPYSPRYIATEVMQFCGEGKNLNTYLLGVLMTVAFVIPFTYQRESEKILVDFYQPGEQHSPILLDEYDNYNVCNNRINLDDPRIKYAY